VAAGTRFFCSQFGQSTTLADVSLIGPPPSRCSLSSGYQFRAFGANSARHDVAMELTGDVVP
jgi:hypothetical protein